MGAQGGGWYGTADVSTYRGHMMPAADRLTPNEHAVVSID